MWLFARKWKCTPILYSFLIGTQVSHYPNYVEIIVTHTLFLSIFGKSEKISYNEMTEESENHQQFSLKTCSDFWKHCDFSKIVLSFLYNLLFQETTWWWTGMVKYRAATAPLFFPLFDHLPFEGWGLTLLFFFNYALLITSRSANFLLTLNRFTVMQFSVHVYNKVLLAKYGLIILSYSKHGKCTLARCRFGAICYLFRLS